LHGLRDQSVPFMKDLDRIVDILCNYYTHRKLNSVESEILYDWLNESQVNENFLTELSDNACWIKNSPACELHDLVRSKLMLLYQK
jgi:hypothetical protein